MIESLSIPLPVYSARSLGLWILLGGFLAPAVQAAAVEGYIDEAHPSTIRIRFDAPIEEEPADAFRVLHHYFDGTRPQTAELAVRRVVAESDATLMLELNDRAPGLGLLEVEHSGRRLEVFNRAHLVGDWMPSQNRPWAGPDFWANRLQDWRVRGGRLECLAVGPDQQVRTVHVLTREVLPDAGTIALSVRTAVYEPNSGSGFNGFLIGAGRGKVDYRAAALIHNYSGAGGGILAVYDLDGRLAFRDMNDESADHNYPDLTDGTVPGEAHKRDEWEEVQLDLEVVPETGGTYELRLSAWDFTRKRFLGAALLRERRAEDVAGSMALVSSPMGFDRGARFWFKDLRMSGTKLASAPERKLGPVVSALHSLSGQALKMTAQFMPVGFADPREAELEYRPAGGGDWSSVKSTIATPGYTAHFKVTGWDDTRNFDYRIRYDGQVVYDGTIRKDPKDKDEIVVAGFTCKMVIGRPPDGSWGEKGFGLDYGRYSPESFWFPFNEVVSAVRKHKPDLLAFTGDQIYESGDPTVRDIEGRFPELDYLYRWYLFAWSLGELGRDTPATCQPDDHDVYQGNIWGAGGARNTTGWNGDGGYMFDAEWVNMVHRTQSWHLPDPPNDTPKRQGIGVFYTGFNFGGVSFFVLEDRGFKSPRPPQYESAMDTSALELAGQRQERELKEWVHDWRGAKMKFLISQTGFAAVSTDIKGEPSRDHDSGGFPPEARDRLIDILRRGGVIALAGDTHLSYVVQHGVEAHRDGIFQFVVPAVANKFARWWQPAESGRNREPAAPDYAGDFVDAWGNKITMHAVANPKVTAEEARQGSTSSQYHIINMDYKPDGYGIVRLNKREQLVRLESWKWNADPDEGESGMYDDWPVTIDLSSRYGGRPALYLPDLRISGQADPVVQVIDENSGEILYTTRAKDGFHRSGVARAGRFTIRVGEPGSGEMRALTGLEPGPEPGGRTIELNLEVDPR